MNKRRTFAPFLTVCACALGSGIAHAQEFPSKAVRILAGERGGGDFAARQIAGGLTGYLGQPVIVENRGIVGAEMLAKAPADGYTLLFYGSTAWISPLLRSVNWDPIRDFAAVTWAIKSPNVLAVHPALPVRSVKDLIALAKARPNDLNYSSGQSGASSHLAAELFKSMAKVNITRVPYRAAGVEIKAKTPAAVVARLNADTVRLLHRDDVKERFFSTGVETVGSTPEEFAAKVKSEMTRLGKVIKDAGIRED